MSKWQLWFGLLLALATLPSSSKAQLEGALSVRNVVATAKAHNPAIKAAMLQLESAHWELLGREAAYEPVLEVDSNLSQQATPNVLGGAVRINKVRRADLGAQLSKHLIWGTDLTLRVSSSVQKSDLIGGITTIPSTVMINGMTIMLPSGVSPGFGVGSFGPLYGLVAKLSLKQPLWRGRGRDVGEANLRQARISQTSNEHTRDRVGSETLRDLLTAYWELWYADEAAAIQMQSQDVAKKERDDAEARSNSGSLAPADVLTFDTEVATRDEALVDANTTRAQRAHELARLLGTNEREGELGSLADEPLDVQAYARELTEQRALAQSAQIKVQESALELARLQRKTAEDPQKPRLDLESFIQTQGLGNQSVGNAADQFVSGNAVSGVITLTYEAPIHDRVRRAEAAKARLAVEVAEEQLRQLREQVLSDVRTALDREAAGEQKVELAQRTTSIAERQLHAEQARYRSGSTTAIAVLNAENNLRSAKLRLARARADLAQSALLIDHLTGDLLARYASP
ncbi:MAG: outer membrane protein [Myxococcaceae bacterium]|nr:outer membrane protein [Myxococcaceae bacterium]